MIHVKMLEFFAPFSVMLLKKTSNKIVRLSIIFLSLSYLPHLQSWYLFKYNLKTSTTFNPNFLCFSEIDDIEK